MRAIAVLSVVAYHAFPNWVKGGFIGVDIFFVISGYLISTILFENLENNKFSFTEFYSRRVRRIFPALLVVLIFCFALGWFALLADEFKQLGKHIAGGAGFISNFVLWNETGYFDDAARTKPLLHLWSLGIEEQFYILWPLLLWLAWKNHFNLLTITSAVAAMSFALNLIKYPSDGVANFYSPQTRFWELLAGSILAHIKLHNTQFLERFRTHAENYITKAIYTNAPTASGTKLRDAQSMTGGLLVIVGVLLITEEKHFPGVWAILPVLGTLMIIDAGEGAWLNSIILSNRALVWIGLISYPLYLWHWPLLSFDRIIASDTSSLNVRITIIIVSMVLAVATYKLVEKPIRFGAFPKIKTGVLAALMISILYVGFEIRTKEGFTFREVNQINATIESGYNGGDGGNSINACNSLNEKDKNLFLFCIRDSREIPKYALLGDSKAAAIAAGLFRTSRENGRWLFIGGTNENGAPIPVISDEPVYEWFQKLTRTAVEFIAKQKNIEKVVLVTATRVLFVLKNDTDIIDLPASPRYDIVYKGLRNVINKFIASGKKVVIVIDNPTLPHAKDCLNRKTSLFVVNRLLLRENPRCVLSLSDHISLSKKYRQLLTRLAAEYPNDVKIFDTIKYMCDLKQGICIHQKNGRSLYSRSDHISDYASGLIGRELNIFLSSY